MWHCYTRCARCWPGFEEVVNIVTGSSCTAMLARPPLHQDSSQRARAHRYERHVCAPAGSQGSKAETWLAPSSFQQTRTPFVSGAVQSVGQRRRGPVAGGRLAPPASPVNGFTYHGSSCKW